MSKVDRKILIDKVLNRGVSDVIERKNMEKKLNGPKKLRVKLGIDPTGKDLHIGHMVVVRKLAEFQALGHNILLLFGNFTGQIGDPSGKGQARAMRTQKELEKNAQKYIEQVKGVLDVNKIEVMWNADWLAPLTFAEVVQLASNFTVAQMIERDMFQERIKRNQPIMLQEFFYPLMQGYDSVAMKADVELGGTDQTFNLLAGRPLQKAHGQAPQDILTVPLLEGLDGKMKMGKSEDNYIGVKDSPKEMYGKTMSIPDDLILRYFDLATGIERDEWNKVKKALAGGENPRNLKMQLAREIVALYHSAAAATKAEKEFVNVFKDKKEPDKIPTLIVPKGVSHNVIDLMIKGNLVSSRGEAKRLIKQGACSEKEDGKAGVYVRIKSMDAKIKLSSFSVILKLGKRKFLKVISK